MSERDHSGFPAEDPAQPGPPERHPAAGTAAASDPAGADPAGADPAGADPAGADPAGAGPAATQPAGRPNGRIRVAVAALIVGLGAAALGGPYALIWSALAPDIPVVKVDDRVAPADPEPEQLVAGDGWFAILGLAIGVAAALAAWWVARRHRGSLVLAALAAGCVLAGVFASWLGQQIGLADYHRALAAAAPGTALSRPPDLRIAATGQWLGVIPKATGVQLVAAFAAVVTYTLLAGWSRYPQLHPAAQPAGEPGHGYGYGYGSTLPPFGADAWGARYDAWGPSGGRGSAPPPNGARAGGVGAGGVGPGGVGPGGVGPGGVGPGGVGPGGVGPGGVSSDSSAPPTPPTEPVRPGRGEVAPPRD